MNRRAFLLGMSTAACVQRPRTVPSPSPSPSPSPAPPAAVEAVFAKTLADAGAPGGAIGIVEGGVVTRTRAFGDGITTRTLFRVESVTKTFTALAALSLIPDLDTRAPYGFGEDVTLRRLLSHTAGFRRNQIVRLRDVRPGHEYEDLFTKNRALLEPGPAGRFEYSNTGYLLVGAMVEAAARAPFSAVLRERVTRPLGMPTATTDSAEVVAFGDFATGRFEPRWLDPYVQRSVGGLHASVEEMATFAARFLDDERARTMATRVVETDEAGVFYGYGLYVVPSKDGEMWMHSGAGQGTCAYFACWPEKRRALVVLVNAAGYRGFGAVRKAF